jgi:hypothetical protein
MNPARHPAKRSAAAKADATATLDPITAYFILPLRQSCGGAKKAAPVPRGVAALGRTMGRNIAAEYE